LTFSLFKKHNFALKNTSDFRLQKNAFRPLWTRSKPAEIIFAQTPLFPLFNRQKLINFQSCVHLLNPSSPGSSRDSCRLAVLAGR
jgi:hypothetical protein